MAARSPQSDQPAQPPLDWVVPEPTRTRSVDGEIVVERWTAEGWVELKPCQDHGKHQ